MRAACSTLMTIHGTGYSTLDACLCRRVRLASYQSVLAALTYGDPFRSCVDMLGVFMLAGRHSAEHASQCAGERQLVGA